MTHDRKSLTNRLTRRLSVRMTTEHYSLVEMAAEREGLQISSFVIMVLVRLHILPESCLMKIKRRPVPFFNALHGLLGVVNKIGGNCKQLAISFPNVEGLHQTHTKIIAAAAAITDALQGIAVPESVNLYRLQGDITQTGHVFNQIVKSVNTGNPNLSGLPYVLHAITRNAVAITATLNGEHVADEELPHNMRMAASEQTQRQTEIV
jgi:hypothetical protein